MTIKTRVTIKKIRECVKEIKIAAEGISIEEPHSLEDDLFEWVLETIAEGAKNPARLAQEALKSKGTEFQKYYA